MVKSRRWFLEGIVRFSKAMKPYWCNDGDVQLKYEYVNTMGIRWYDECDDILRKCWIRDLYRGMIMQGWM